MPTYTAVDLGATSGRVVNVRIAPIRFEPTSLYNWSEMEQQVQWSAEA